MRPFYYSFRLLLDGHSVQLGDWGSFRLTCNSTPSNTKAEVSAGNIKNLNIRFVPEKEMKETINRATFRAAESLVTPDQEEMAATSCVKERGYPEIGADIPFFKKILIFPEKDTDLFGKR